MEAIRKMTKIKNNSLQLVDLESFNNQTVEVIIFPVKFKKEVPFTAKSTEKKKITKNSKPSLSKLKGIWKNRNIDIKTLRAEAWPERK